MSDEEDDEPLDPRIQVRNHKILIMFLTASANMILFINNTEEFEYRSRLVGFEIGWLVFTCCSVCLLYLLHIDR